MLMEATAAPRIEGGTISDRYRGAMTLAMPVMKLFQKRPQTKAARFGAKSCRKTPPREKQ